MANTVPLGGNASTCIQGTGAKVYPWVKRCRVPPYSGIDGALKYEQWAEVLAKDDPKRDYLLRGIKHGFHITDPTAISESVEVDNYRSATCARNASRVEAQIQEEVANGRYGVCAHNCVSVGRN